MTDNEFADLQYWAAKAAADKKKADQTYNRLMAKLHGERCRRSGLLGKIAANSRYAIVIQDIMFAGETPFSFTGMRLNHDGSASHQRGTVYAARARISTFLNEKVPA